MKLELMQGVFFSAIGAVWGYWPLRPEIAVFGPLAAPGAFGVSLPYRGPSPPDTALLGGFLWAFLPALLFACALGLLGGRSGPGRWPVSLSSLFA